MRLVLFVSLVFLTLGLAACYITPTVPPTPVGGGGGGGGTPIVNPNADLIGRWDLSSFSATDGVVSIQINYPLAMLVFREGGTGTAYSMTPSGDVAEYSFRWSVSGNTVWVGSGDTATLSGGNLILSDTLYESGSVFYVTAVFHKVL